MSAESLRAGITIIADSYFETYAEELAEDIYDMKTHVIGHLTISTGKMQPTS